MNDETAIEAVTKLWGINAYTSHDDNVCYLCNEAGPEEGMGASWIEAFADLYHRFPNTKRV